MLEDLPLTDGVVAYVTQCVLSFHYYHDNSEFKINMINAPICFTMQSRFCFLKMFEHVVKLGPV